VAGVLFAVFPFSYQAVAVYGHNVHPTTTGLLVLGLHFYLNWLGAGKGTRRFTEISHGEPRRGRRRAWFVLTLFVFLVALLSHESAILFGAFVVLVDWTRNEQAGENHSPFTIHHSLFTISISPAGIFFTLLGVFYIIGYQFLPITRAPQVVEAGGGLVPKVLYLGQAWAYPVTWLAHLVPEMPANTVVWLSVGLAFVLMGWRLWQSAKYEVRRSRSSFPPSHFVLKITQHPIFFGLAWFGLAGALVALPLPSGYLLHGPRLLYLGSVGLAIFWSGLIVGTRMNANERGFFNRQSFLSNATSNLFLFYLVVSNIAFVWGRLDAYKEMTAGVAVAERAGTDNVLFVNLPQWVAPPRNDFAEGSEFVAQLGDYLFVEELGRANGITGQVQAVRVPDLLADFGYGYAVHEQTGLADVVLAEAETAVVITHYGEGGLWAENAGILRPPIITTPPIATFGNYQLLQAHASQCGGVVSGRFVWRLAGEPVPTQTMFAQAIGVNGDFAQADAPPLQLRPDLLPVPANWEIVDLRRIEVQSADTFLLGVYDYVTGERMPAFSLTTTTEPTPLTDNALTLSITPCAE
jgi:hypothetical protein